jgi:hypothetical protein
MKKEPLDITLHVCTWKMPFSVKSLDDQIDRKMLEGFARKLTKLKRIRTTFVKRWSDKETGEIIAPVKAVHDLGTLLHEFGLEHIADRQAEKFIRPYEHGKRPLPKGRYE